MKKLLNANEIFKNGSTTYYYSSFFFSSELRQKVTILYSFVRTIDNLVDVIPQDTKKFYQYKTLFYQKGRKGKSTGSEIIDAFLDLERSFGFDQKWIDAFWFAMELDIKQKSYRNEKELIQYMYGSAEVIGLMMCRLMSLSTEAFATAQLLGRSMQYINFLRDISEDNYLGRTYIPQSLLKKYGLVDLKKETALAHPKDFSALIRSQIARYHQWQHEAEQGFQYLPARARIAIETASDLYGWTAEKIAENPLLVFEKKIKPSKLQVFLFGFTNTLRTIIKR